MAKVFIEETTLTAIGDAIRGKEGTTELVPVNDMATRISSIQGGSDPVIESLEIKSNGTYTATDCDGYSPITVNVPQDGAPSEEELTFSGVCDYLFRNGNWDWFVEKYKDKITTKDITRLEDAFRGMKLKAIPFDINVNNCDIFSYALADSKNLTECPKIRGVLKFSGGITFTNLLSNCHCLRDIEDLFEPSMLDGFIEYIPSSSSNNPKLQNIFYNCYSLRRLPSWLSKLKLNPQTKALSTTYTMYNSLFAYCYCLDEALNIPVNTSTTATTTNMFKNTFDNTSRLKDFTFETDNGQPVVTNWKSQTINLSTYVGYIQYTNFITLYNSGLTEDTVVRDDATYQALKNNPDWYTSYEAYSRYNHDSAVNTINSLPDTSAYLASAGGTNTIKFKGASGSATDGGAINTLTAEEIAVATAKGWTVTLS